jgi:DNA invertase Pin-like site-specific DNA recombinase
MVAEFESDLIRLRTREGMKVVKAKGHLRGSGPSSTIVKKPTRSRYWTPGEYTTADLLTSSEWPVPPSIGLSSEKGFVPARSNWLGADEVY